MKTFPGWREVGRAMRWARRQDRVTVEREKGGYKNRVALNRWRKGTAVAVALHIDDVVEFSIHCKTGVFEQHDTDMTAATALRVLAALDLIPAELAEPQTEIGRRCSCHHSSRRCFSQCSNSSRAIRLSDDRMVCASCVHCDPSESAGFR